MEMKYHTLVSWDLQGKTHPDPPVSRGTTSRRKLSCGCIEVTYSSPEIPFSRSAIEKYCKLHQSERLS